MSDSASDAGADMRAFWNGPAGTSWVEKQVLFDEMYQPIVDALAWSVVEEGARSVLDVGCGTGAARRRWVCAARPARRFPCGAPPPSPPAR